mmetsp:Transcript_18584/g.13340  ORF Transcript_18584/g.13340 Transcript_18584/m.13340 type:complete len:108 (-) Transcript_18584:431-754(-)
MSIYVLFYLFVFSCIPHKEVRFLLPALPFIWLMTSQFLTECVVTNFSSWFTRKLIFLGIVAETVYYVFYTLYDQTHFVKHEWLVTQDPTSFYDLNAYDVPHHSYLHR